MIRETITFKFADEAQQRRFHDRLDDVSEEIAGLRLALTRLSNEVCVMDSKMAHKVAWAIYYALERTSEEMACVEPPAASDDGGSLVDGRFDFFKVAEELQKALNAQGLGIAAPEGYVMAHMPRKAKQLPDLI